MQLKRMPSDHSIVTCFDCRRIREDAAQYQIKPAALLALREALRSRVGWAFIISVILGGLAGIGSFAGALIYGADVHRTCDLAIGGALITFSASALLFTWRLLAWHVRKIVLLRKDKERAL